MRKRQERPLEAANAADADADANRRPRKAYGIDASVRKARLAQGADAAQRLVLGMRKARPAVCEWLSRERHVLPEIVNVVYMLELRSATVSGPFDLIRMAQYMPNTKYKPPNFAALTIRISPATGMLYAGGKLVLIRTRSLAQARYYAQVYRQAIERIPLIMRREDTDEIVVQTLEGHLECKHEGVQNIVGSGALPQDGVHLTRLLYSDEEKVNWDPGGFINLIYYDRLPSGAPFCANIANTGKIVIMGLKDMADIYATYRVMCRVLHDYEDPHVPQTPKERHIYRMQQLSRDSRFLKADATKMRNLLDAEFLGDEFDVEEDFDVRNPNGARDAQDEEDDDAKLMRLVEEMGLDRHAPVLQPEEKLPENEPLLWTAALRGQYDNVKVLLDQDDSALWIPGERTSSMLLERLSALPAKTTEHTRILYMLQLRVRRDPRNQNRLLPAELQ